MNYPLMYKEFDDQRLIDLSRNIYTCLYKSVPMSESRRNLAMKGMYATEELKDRGYTDTVQDLIAELAEKEGLFNND